MVPALDQIHSASASAAPRQLTWQTCQVAVKLALKRTVELAFYNHSICILLVINDTVANE